LITGVLINGCDWFPNYFVGATNARPNFNITDESIVFLSFLLERLPDKDSKDTKDTFSLDTVTSFIFRHNYLVLEHFVAKLNDKPTPVIIEIAFALLK
jgi:hypothetical protein